MIHTDKQDRKRLWNQAHQAAIEAKRNAKLVIAERKRVERAAIKTAQSQVASSSPSSSLIESSSLISTSTATPSTSSSLISSTDELSSSTMHHPLSTSELIQYDRKHVVHADVKRMRTRQSKADTNASIDDIDVDDGDGIVADDDGFNRIGDRSKRQRCSPQHDYMLSETLESSPADSPARECEFDVNARLYYECLRCLLVKAVPIRVVIGTYTFDFPLRDCVSQRLRLLMPMYNKLMNIKLPDGGERLTVESVNSEIGKFKFPIKLPRAASCVLTSLKHLKQFANLANSRMWIDRCFSCWRTIQVGCVHTLRRDHPNVVGLLQKLLDRAATEHLEECQTAIASKSSMPASLSSSDNLPFCHFCWDRIKNGETGRMPSVCMLNNLMLEDVPPELQDLNRMEKRMIARVNLFHSIVILSSSGQQGMKGLSVGFKVSVPGLINKLPRALNDAGYIVIRPPDAIPKDVPAAVGMTMYESRRPSKAMTDYYVRPSKIETALLWLLKNNVIYHDVRVECNKFAESDDWLVCPNIVPSAAPANVMVNPPLESRVYHPPSISLPVESRSTDQIADDNEAELVDYQDRKAAAARAAKKKDGRQLKARIEADRRAGEATRLSKQVDQFGAIQGVSVVELDRLHQRINDDHASELPNSNSSHYDDYCDDEMMQSVIAISKVTAEAELMRSDRANIEEPDTYNARIHRIIGPDRKIFRIPGDGDCVFNSVLTGCQFNRISVRADCSTPASLRHQTGVFINNHRDEFHQITGTNADWCSVKQLNCHVPISHDVIIPELGTSLSRTLDDCVRQLMNTSEHNDWNIPFGLPGTRAIDIDLFDYIPLVLSTILNISIHAIYRYTSSYADLVNDESMIAAIEKDRSVIIVHSRARDHWDTVIDRDVCDTNSVPVLQLMHPHIKPLPVASTNMEDTVSAHNHGHSIMVDDKCSAQRPKPSPHVLMMPHVPPPLPPADEIAVSSYATFMDAAPNAGTADESLGSIIHQYGSECDGNKLLWSKSAHAVDEDIEMTNVEPTWVNQSEARPVYKLQRVGGRPVTISEQNAHEAFAHPCSFPTGENHMGTRRTVPLSMINYLRTRLLSPYRDRLIKNDVAWLFFAVQTYQWHQIRNAIMVATHQRFSVGDGRQAHSDAATGKYSRHNVDPDEDATEDTNTPHFSSSTAAAAPPSAPVTAGIIKSKLNDDAKLRNLCFVYLRNVRGTIPYWMHTRKDLFALLEMLGSPTYFVTLSANDCNWIGCLVNITGKSAEECEAMDPVERKAAVAENPDLAAQYFMFRWTQFWKHVMNGPVSPLGKIKDFFWRVEFQQRGSPHIHMLLWIDGAPDTSTDAGLALLPDYISQHVSCEIPPLDDPNDDGLHRLVSTVQQHHCTSTCQKNGKSACRFGYPKLPCAKTRLREPTDHVRASDMCILKRSHCDTRTNPYNPTLLRAWGANMDIQAVTKAAGCIAYVISYVTKEEPASLQHVMADALNRLPSGSSRWTTLLRLSSAIVGQREVSAQECAFIILGLVYRKSSRTFISVNSLPIHRRLRMLKANWKKEANSSTDVFRDSIFQRYEKRPIGIDPIDHTDFDSMSLREYAMWFRVVNKSKPNADIYDNDEVGAQDGEDDCNEPIQHDHRERHTNNKRIKRQVKYNDDHNADLNDDHRDSASEQSSESDDDDHDTHSDSDHDDSDDDTNHKNDINPKYHDRQGFYQQQNGIYIRRTMKEQCVQSPHLTVKSDGDSFYYSLLLQYLPFRFESKILDAFDVPVHAHAEGTVHAASSLRVEPYPTARSKFIDCPSDMFPHDKCNEMRDLIQQALSMRSEDEACDKNDENDTDVDQDQNDPMSVRDQDVPLRAAWNARQQDFNTNAVNDANELTIADNVAYDGSADDRFDSSLPIDAMATASHHSAMSSTADRYNQMYVPSIFDAEWKRRKGSMTASQRVLFDHISKHVRLCSLYREHVLVPGSSSCLPPAPLHLFVTGGAGVGKSYMIAMIYELLRRTSGGSSSMPGSTTNNVCMMMAPTGVAAFNIGGLTIHRALDIKVELERLDCNQMCSPLSDHKCRQYRQEFAHVTHIIIDEVSMVSYTLLQKIDMRCREVSSVRGGAKMPFGGFNMILVGDLFQLSPVMASWIYNSDASPPVSHLWRSLFDIFELVENVRQMGTPTVPPAESPPSSSSAVEHDACLQWTSLLNRMRTGDTSEADIKVLCSRCVAPIGFIDDQKAPFNDSVHLFSRNDDCDKWNSIGTERMMRELNIGAESVFKFNAIDSIRSGNISKLASSRSDVSLHIPSGTRECGGIPTTLTLVVGSRVMLRRNVKTLTGLVNGATGIVTGFTWSNNVDKPVRRPDGTVEMPEHVWVKFDDPRAGKSPDEQRNSNRRQSRLHINSTGGIDLQAVDAHPSAINHADNSTAFHFSHDSVAISPIEVQFESDKNNMKIRRMMIPLVLNWACTVHKVQGLTLQNVVVSMKNLFQPGMAYVALSRVTKITGLCLTDYDPAQFKKEKKNPFRRNNDSFDEYTRMRDITRRRRCVDCTKLCRKCMREQAKNLASEQLCRRCRLCRHPNMLDID